MFAVRSRPPSLALEQGGLHRGSEQYLIKGIEVSFSLGEMKKRSASQAGLSGPAFKRMRSGGVIWAPSMVAKKRATALPELKNIDTTDLNFPAFGATTGQLTLLNGCIQGSAATNRIGRRIRMVSVYLRGRILMAGTSTGSSPIRIIIFYDRQTNGAAPTATDLLTSDAISSFNNLNNNRRFQVVADITRSCIGTAGPQALYFSNFKKIDLSTEFNTGNAGTVADITTGSLYALCYASPGIGVASLITNLNVRVRFSDA